MKDNLDELKTIQRRIEGRVKNAWTKQIKIWKKSEAIGRVKELNKIKNEELLNKLDQFKQNSKTR
jgi:hypothetical protein